jgi:poly(3-hydroxybutyrate) depolymerase
MKMERYEIRLRLLTGLLLLVTAFSAAAQEFAPIEDLQWLYIEDTVGLIAPKYSEDAAKARAIMNRAYEARAAGKNGEMRYLLSQVRAVLAGQEWTPGIAFTASLDLRPAPVVIDPKWPLILSIGQHFPAPAPATQKLEFQVGIRSVSRPDSPRPTLQPLAKFAWLGRDLVDRPAASRLDLASVDSGTYELVVDVLADSQLVGSAVTKIFVVRNYLQDREQIKNRAFRLRLSETMKASILYPLDVAVGLDERSRQVRSFDMRSALDRSLALIDAAEAGRDPLWQATGDLIRHYWSDLSACYVPYRLYVPKRWDRHTPTAMVVFLHGSNGDENSVLQEGKAIALAEEHGWIILSPLGDNPNSGWGNRLRVVTANGSMPPARPTTINNIVLSKDGLVPEPAEVDVLRTIDLTRTEYNVDSRRIYLVGNSMGGEETWHLAARHPRLWAAVAPAAGPIDPEAFPYEKLRQMPVLAVHGDNDPIISYEASKQMVEKLRQLGAPANLLSVPAGGHGALSKVLPEVFSFFEANQRSTSGVAEPVGEPLSSGNK